MGNKHHHETLLLETLLSGLDAREAARRSGSEMLMYLADMLVLRAREELGQTAGVASPAAACVTPPPPFV